jgi:hypothetical protein
MNCPVCGAQARRINSPNSDGVVVHCPRCGDYAILGNAFDSFLRLGFDQRVEALKRAKKSALGSMPIIKRVSEMPPAKAKLKRWLGWFVRR